MAHMLKHAKFDKKFEMHIDVNSFVIGRALTLIEHLMVYENKKLFIDN